MLASASLSEDAAARRSFGERHWPVLLALIVVLAAGLRVYGLGRLSVWYDESTSLFGLQYVDSNLRFLKAEETRLIPLNTLLLFVWYHVVTAWPGVEMGSRASDALLDLLPATFSMLAVPLVFTLGRYLTGRAAAGLAAALLTAISPLHLYYASELGPHSLYAFLVLATAYCNVRALEENRLRFWIGTVVLEALAFYAYYFSVFYLAAVNLFVLFHLRAYRPVLMRWVASQAIAGLLVLPAIVLAMFVFRVHASAQEHWFPFPTLTTLAITLKSWFAGYSPRTRVYWTLLMLGLGLFAMGAWSLRHRRRSLSFLLFTAFLPLIIQWIFWNTQNFAFYTLRIQLAYSLPGFILAGAGLTGLRWRPARWGAFAALAVLTVPVLQDEYAQRIHPVFHHRLGARFKVDNRGAAEFVRANWRDGDVVAHASTVTLGPFRYHYLPNVTQAFTGFGEEEWQAHIRNYPDIRVWESLGFVPQRIDEFTAKAPRVWYVDGAWEPAEYFELGLLLREWLDAHGVRVAERHLSGVDVYLYDLSAGPGAAAGMDRVADLGWYTLLRPHRDGGTPENPAAFELPAGRDPAALDVWFSPLEDGRYAGPRRQDGALEFGLRVRNRSGEPRSVEVHARAAPQVGAALGLSRPAGTEAWRPVAGHFGKVSYLARLSEAVPEAPLSGWIQTAGPTELYVELERSADRAAPPPGDLIAELRGPGDEVQQVGLISAAAQLGPGWGWQRVGSLPPSPQGATLVLTAKKPAGEAQARVHVDHFAAVAPLVTAVWEPVGEGHLDLQGFEEAALKLSVKSVEDPSATDGDTYLIEVFDPKFKVYRSLLWHAETGGKLP
jgi:hypothetical protein